MARPLSPSDSDHWESRRFPACDRCRNQKLRCLRDRRRNPSSPCSRCQRAQTDCVVSLRGRPGRRSGKRCDREQSTIPNQTENTELHPALPPGQHWESNVDESWFNIIGAIEGNIAPTPENPSDSFRDTSLEANASIGFDYPEPDNNYDPLDSSALDFNSDERRPPKAPMLLYPKDIGLRDANSDERTDPGARLFQIPHKLSMQLQRFQSRPWDITIYLKLEHTSGDETESSTSKPREDHALISTFDILSELKGVLTELAATQNCSNLLTSTSRQGVTNISYLLAALACYLQILALYDCVVTHVIEQVTSSSATRAFVLDSTPRFSIGGIIVPPSKNLLGRSLIQVLEQNIRPLETVLALPVDYQVSRFENDDVTLDGSRLLKEEHEAALFDFFSRLESAGTGNSSIKGLVRDLREKMTHIEELGS